MKPLQQYFLMFLSNLQNEIGKFLLNFAFGYIGSERVNDGTFTEFIDSTKWIGMGKESFPRNFKKRRLFKGILLDTENLVSVLF